ncbi:Glutaredoxin-like domain protein [Candidatus Kryptobacter tengchongensis]|uniref:Glutaredoxin-like domain protein n=1 Tax=Kryptobacter tengchongensis TaxID=1643429 RepID=A0A656DCH4_KRYT1|nr:thioredoxin family protein [Candidatus Kryptobacter tengchongensis]CUT05284.1 Glutaredoxin-like domain protein [Candidatus Kryptobacter tengchongensis]CUU09896.1 Glutaredoxin-like domain protein [Candidatus Kryptobacter tengchongensis]
MFLDADDREELRKRFEENLVNKVRVIHFTRELDCQYCRETKQLLTELSELSDKIQLEIYNFYTDTDKVEQFKIDKVPATVIASEDRDYGIRYFGIPSGYEFASFLLDIEMVSRGVSGLSQRSIEKIKEIDVPVHIQVFVTPTCPYCPSAVHLAHQLAMENDLITADMVEAIEFPDLAEKYMVMGVPKVVMNDVYYFEGALPERHYVDKVVEAARKTKETLKQQN